MREAEGRHGPRPIEGRQTSLKQERPGTVLDGPVTPLNDAIGLMDASGTLGVRNTQFRHGGDELMGIVRIHATDFLIRAKEVHDRTDDVDGFLRRHGDAFLPLRAKALDSKCLAFVTDPTVQISMHIHVVTGDTLAKG